MDKSTKRNWTQDVALTLLVTLFVVDKLYAINSAVDELSRPTVVTAARHVEDTYAALRNDPETAGAFRKIAARKAPPPTVLAGSDDLWRASPVVTVDTVRWEDDPETSVVHH